MGLSLNKFTFQGGAEFDLNFALGYASKSDISAYIEKEVPVNLAFDWLTPSRVRITVPSELQVGDTVVFARTVSKTTLSVDLTQPGNLTREGVQTAILHSMYVYHEILDGRFSDLVEVSDAMLTSINLATETALSNLLFRANFTSEKVFALNLTAESTATYTSGGFTALTDKIGVFIEQNPSTMIEVLLYNAGVLFYSFTVSPAGIVTVTYKSDIELQKGPITSQVVGGNYASGARVTVALPIVNSAVVDLNVELSDYVALFEEARTT